MNILFSHSYFLRFDPKQWQLGQPYPPLGTLYAAALMREKGFSVSLFDTMFAHSPQELLPALEKNHPSYFVLYDDGFNYLTKMCLTNMREAAFDMIALAKKKCCTVIVCSSDATDHHETYLDAGADFVILGEGEKTLSCLVEALQRGEEEFFSMEGIAFKKDGALVRTTARSVMRDLDSLPLPAWDLVDIRPYKSRWMKEAGYFSINIGTTRGCPYKCNWCAKPIYGNRYNARSPQNVVRELVYLKEIFAFDHVWFCDDIFGLKPGWVQEFADLVEKQGLHFRFKIQSRADLLMQENYVSALARAGAESVWMGAESGSQKILDAMDKGITVQQIRGATHLLKKHGIRPCFFIQFGYLGESGEDIRKTIEMISELRPSEIGISVSYPLPGTGFYEKVKEQLQHKSNWTDSDELALMFHNTYQAKFYKQLHRYVHSRYRKQQAFDHLKKILASPLSGNWKIFKKAISGFLLVPLVFISKIRLKQLEKIS